MESPSLEILLEHEPTVASGGSIRGTLVVIVEGPFGAGTDEISMRLLAKTGGSTGGGDHELTRQRLHTGDLEVGRHEIPFEVAVPDDIISYSGDQFDLKISLDAVLVGRARTVSAEPIEVTVLPDGVLQVAPAARALTLNEPKDNPWTFFAVCLAAGAIAAVAEFGFAGSIGPSLAVLLVCALVMGAFGLFINRRAQNSSALRFLRLEVAPNEGGIVAEIAVKANQDLVLDSVVFTLEAKEKLKFTSAITSTRPAAARPTDASQGEIVELAGNVSLKRGEVLEWVHEYRWRAADRPNVRLGENALGWWARVDVEVRGNGPESVQIPIEVGTTELIEAGPVVATEVPDE